LANDVVIFSKKAVGRHAEPGEVVRLLQEKLGIQPAPRET
jgi:selenoprotein W-related protein